MFGWFHILEILCEYRIDRINAILELEAYTVFNHLVYMKEKNRLDAAQLKRNNLA